MGALRSQLERVRLKGPKWDVFVIICLQASVALLLLYMVVGAEIGFVQRTQDPQPGSEWVGPMFALWSVLAIGTSIGLLRDRWWAYLAETLVVIPIPLAFAVFGIDKFGNDEIFGVEIPGVAEVRYFVFLIAAVFGLWIFYKRGLQRYREQMTR